MQEAAEKWTAEARAGVRLAMIGRLQSNKAGPAAQMFDEIQSVDSLRLATRLSRLAQPRRLPVYLEVNVGGEASKAGFSPAGLREALAPISALDGLELVGLMTIPPAGRSPEDGRPYFAALRALSWELRQRYPALGAGLSMGMSGDFEVAIEEGATVVRVGQAIYGPRPSLY